MASPLDFKGHSSGGVYGTHSSGSSERCISNNTTRQRRNPMDYGPFSSPHGSFDEPNAFPPYAELPFTSLKRRRQLQDSNSFVKWAMRAVLLSPVVVLVLWSIVAVLFANSHQTGQSRAGNANNSNMKSQSRRGTKRMLPFYPFGNGSKSNNNNIQPNGMLTQADISQPLQDQQGSLLYDANGNVMMMVPQQQKVQGTELMMSGYQQQQLPQQVVPMQSHGRQIPIASPPGGVSNSIPSNSIQQMQQRQQQQDSSLGYNMAVQPQQALMATNTDATVKMFDAQQRQEIPRTTLENFASSQLMVQNPVTNAGFQIQQQNDSSNSGTIVQTASAMQQQPLLSSSSIDTAAETVILQENLQKTPSKQAIYYYDPKDTLLSRTGDILQLPVLVYDDSGIATPLSELHHQAPIYVQPPLLGASSTTGSSGSITVLNTDGEVSNNELVSQLALEASSSVSANATSVLASNKEPSLPPPPLGASMSIPQTWGSSTSQDQTIIIATVAVMALLVGALSARRMRSKSFLSSCIENEALEDGIRYDAAYTTTAEASGAVGADSSYNTFGGWKGDLEKFDV